MALRLPLVLDTTNGEPSVLLSGDYVDPAALGTGTPSSSNFLRGDGAWIAISSGVITAGTATIDFGSTGAQEASVAVTGQTGITATSSVFIRVAADATSANHTASDHRYLQLFAALTWGSLVAGTGFTIYATSTSKLTGQYTINWQWS